VARVRRACYCVDDVDDGMNWNADWLEVLMDDRDLQLLLLLDRSGMRDDEKDCRLMLDNIELVSWEQLNYPPLGLRCFVRADWNISRSVAKKITNEKK
jgi:hypothetical protein